jgi:hypothetical protein
MNAGACIHCNRHERDAAGTVKHEAYCPMFMRGPDAGGDPHEWPTLEQAIAEAARGGRREVQIRLTDELEPELVDNRTEEH